MVQLQMMIDYGIITGIEPFGVFRSNYLDDVYFDEAVDISVENNWENKDNVVYIE